MENPNPNLPEEAELSLQSHCAVGFRCVPMNSTKREAVLSASTCKTGCKLSARLSGKSISPRKLQQQAARVCLFQKGVPMCYFSAEGHSREAREDEALIVQDSRMVPLG